ncbi:hypothetical protein JH146_0579 [Methanocaldococcus bathoardescens]|uniref:Uncharacterized protein n=1 Tax=Methanocaldococcus bathoardescens TaxID=1301915 RepID=A0A076LG22_9EURY|nr:hypothetical protein [Methanocaldococcus bathoardescens]AIJ05428.1 hypothetical protein JH146_0579 [Methanocaldococcus bathoardescens]
MKKIVIAIILSISIAVLFAGCVSEEGGNYEETKGGEKVISSLLDVVPKSSEKVVYTETEGFINLLGEDSKIVNAYKKLIGKYGLSVDDIEYTIQADNAYILKGYGLDEYKFMDELGLNYKEKNYKGANILVNEDYGYAVAKYKNYLIHGNVDDVERVIDTLSGDYPAITEKDEIKKILENVDDDYAVANIEEGNNAYYGAFIYPKGRDVKFEIVIVFDNIDDAKEQYQYMKEELENEKSDGNIKDYDIERDGNVVVADIIMSKDEFLGEYADSLGLNLGDIENNAENQYEQTYQNEENEKEEYKNKNTEKVNVGEPFNLIPSVFWASYVDVDKFSNVVKGGYGYEKLKDVLKCYGLTPDDIEFYLSIAPAANVIKTNKLNAYDYLKRLGCEYKEENYKGATLLIYKSPFSALDENEAVTNYRGYFIFGLEDNVKNIIDAINGETSLMIENDNIKEIISEISKGYFAFKLYDLFDSDGGEFYYEDGNDVVIKGLWIAMDEDYANKRANIIKEDYESNGYNDYNVKVEGNRVISELRISKEEFADYYGDELADVHWLGLHELENCKSSAETEELANNEEQANIEQQIEEQQTNMEEQKEQQFENKETNVYELPLTWKEVEVAGMDGVMFDFGSKKVTFNDIYEYSHYTSDFEDPIIIDGNRLWSFGDFGGIYGNYYIWKSVDEGWGFDAEVDDIYLAEMPYNVKAMCYDMYGAGWFIADDNGKIHHVIFEEYNETTDKTGNVKIYLLKPKVDVVVANLDVDELMAGISNNGKNYKIVLGWKGNKLYLITMDAKKFEDWAYNIQYTKGYSEPFPNVKIKEFDFDGNIIDARGEYGAGNYQNYIVVATNNGLYIITVENREPDEFKITDALKTNIKVYAFDVYSGKLACSDGNNVYYTDIKSRYESENSDRYVYYFGRNYEGALSLSGVTGLSITTNYNEFGTQLKVAGNGYIKTYNFEFESKKDAEGNYLYDENGDPIYIVKFVPKIVYYDGEVYDKYYDINVPFAGKYIYREDWGNSKSGRVAFRVYTTDNKLYLFGTAWG